jgi:hypothetical protein
MIDRALELVNLWSNPVFHRFRRSQLRLRKALLWYLLTVIVTSFVVSLTYILRTNSGVSGEEVARELWIPLLVIQGLTLMIKGTGKTSAGLIQDKMDQTLDYQRLTPVSPLRNVLGYLFGLPLLEYAMFALTLPHLIFIVAVGNIPLASVVSVYLIFFTCTIFYHMTAIAMGMVMRKWVWGYLLSIFAVAFLNLILPTTLAQFGLRFLQYLSVWPVVGQEILPLILSPAQLASGNSPIPIFLNRDAVPFFNWMLSPFVFTLSLQAGLILTFGTMAVRRWKLESKHSLSKPYSLAVLAVFVVLVAGNLWPAITGRELPFSLIGITSLEQAKDFLAIALPVVYSVTIWLLCLFLFAVVVPTHNDYVRGVRRAVKLDRTAARPWDDDSANIPFMGLFALIALLGYWTLYRTMAEAGFYGFLNGSGISHWRLPVALGLVLIYSLLLLQTLEIRGTVLTALLVWLVPILVAIVSAAAIEDVSTLQTVIASISPLALIIMSGLLPLEPVVPVDAENEFGMVLTGVNTGLFLVTAQIAALALRWAQIRRRLC